jgi:hypothetical protein
MIYLDYQRRDRFHVPVPKDELKSTTPVGLVCDFISKKTITELNVNFSSEFFQQIFYML